MRISSRPIILAAIYFLLPRSAAAEDQPVARTHSMAVYQRALRVRYAALGRSLRSDAMAYGARARQFDDLRRMLNDGAVTYRSERSASGASCWFASYRDQKPVLRPQVETALRHALGESAPADLNALVKDDQYGAMTADLRALVEKTASQPLPPSRLTVQAVARVGALEQATAIKMDRRFLASRRKLHRLLRRATSDQVMRRGLVLVRRLNEATQSPPETVKIETGHGDASGSSAAHGQLRGPLGGDRGGFDMHSKFKAEWSQHLPILEARNYAVAVRTVNGSETSVGSNAWATPMEARAIVELALTAADVIHQLRARDPGKAADLSRWLEHSSITFNIDRQALRSSNSSAAGPQPITVHLARVRKDALQLHQAGIISLKMRQGLEKELRLR
jgi:hypothetical protein